LAKLEREVAGRVKREELADCNCTEMKSAMPLFAMNPEVFQAEMDKTCPVHGFRRLGEIRAHTFVEPSEKCSGTLTEKSAELLQLIDKYEFRLAQHSQASVAAEKDDSKES
jgi:hypothetical protein